MNNAPELIHRSDDDVPDFVGKWWGWASPIGLGLFLIELGVVALLVRVAIFGMR